MEHRQKAAEVDLARVANEGRVGNQEKRIEKREPKGDERRRDPKPIEV